ncbi:MAG: class I SAM-dependent methyltransferase [Gemmataceae bacterium]|nr:class I SAM-dependent methyltransferase [Gemmataceae bacterium]
MRIEERSFSPPSAIRNPQSECLYCGGASFRPLYRHVQDRLGYVPGTWAFDRCTACGSALLAPLPAEEEIPSFYPPVYGFTPDLERRGRWGRLLADLEHRVLYQPLYEGQVRLVLRGIRWQGRQGVRLLDVGCGRGLRLVCLRRLGFAVHGMDCQAGDIDYLQHHLQIPAVCTDFAGLRSHFPANSFEVITAFHVLEHVPDVVGAIRTCLALLKPGGWFVAASPLIDSLQAELLKRHWLAVTEAPRHLSLPSQQGFREVCRRAGGTAVELRHDATLNCAGFWGLSLVPGATSSLANTRRRLVLLQRMLAASVSALLVPWCLLENLVLRRPAAGMVFTRKPLA